MGEDRVFTFSDRLVCTVRLSDQKVLQWTSFGESLFGIDAGQAIGRGCFTLLRNRNTSTEAICRADCVAVQHYRADEVFQCPNMDISETVRNGTVARITGIPYLESSGRQTAELYAWPVKTNVTTVPLLRIQAFRRCLLLARDGSIINPREWRRKKSIELLRILFVKRREPTHRDELATILWPHVEPHQAWPRLKVVVHSLRQELFAVTGRDDLIVTEGERYGLNLSLVEIDLAAFENLEKEGRLLEREHLKMAKQAYEAALQIYDDNILSDSGNDDYVLAERRRLRQMADTIRARLARMTLSKS